MHLQPTIYMPAATSHLLAVCTPNQPKPMPNATTDSTMRILGLELPKSGLISLYIQARVSFCTCIAANDEEDQNLDCETDAICQ